MANRPSLSDVAGGSTLKPPVYNSNNQAIELSYDNLIGRGGVSENNNSMTNSLDMDLHKIINLGAPTANTNAARLIDVVNNGSSAAGADATLLRSELASSTSGLGIELVERSSIKINTKSDLSATPGFSGAVAIMAARLTVGDGGEGIFHWIPTLSLTSTDTANIALDPLEGIYVSATGGYWKRNLNGKILIDWFGANGDFVPSTGAGTDSRAGIQAAINYCQLVGGVVTANSKGHYYLGTGYDDVNWQIQIGSSTTSNSANNVVFDGNEASFYQGAAGKTFAIHNANNTKFIDTKVFGYTGGTLGSSRENDAILMLGRNSKNTRITGNYFTNSLGDCIYVVGAADVAGGGNGFHCSGVEINSNILKERYGDGVKSTDGGTKSREAIACIEADGINIHDNTIYGSIDFEPNLDNQIIHNAGTHNNQFRDGHVTAQSSIGTNYWHDEPINESGGSTIACYIHLVGPSGIPDISEVSACHNKFETGTIVSGKRYEFALLQGNTFQNGLITLSNDTGNAAAKNTLISDNHAEATLAGQDSFIVLNGQCDAMVFSHNLLFESGAVYCIDMGTTPTPTFGAFDAGNTYDSNTAPNGTSNFKGIISVLSSSLSAEPNVGVHFSPQKVFTLVGAGLTVDFKDNIGDSWYIQQANGTAVSIANISNSMGDGQLLEIMAEAASGGTLTLIHSSSLVMKGAVDAVLSNTNIVILRRSQARWVEVGRNF